MRLVLLGIAMAALTVLAVLGAVPASGAPREDRIVFRWVTNCDLHTDCSDALFTARSDGSGVRVVSGRARLPLRNGGVQPRWSPDGSKIVYVGSLGPVVDSVSGILVMDADGTGKRFLCGHDVMGTGDSCSFGHFPAWSPDGERVAYTYWRQGGQIGIGLMHADGSERRLLTLVDEPENLDWSPDGRRIAFTRLSSTGVFVVNSDGSGMRRITRMDAWYPRWSPDGRSLLVIGGQERGNVGNLFVVPWRGGKPSLVVQQPDIRSADWSPDGKRIAYAVSAAGKRSPTRGIYVLDLATRRAQRLTLRPCIVAGKKSCTDSGTNVYEIDWR